jgi:septum formation protein
MLVLASASPRRRELLAQGGFTFRVLPAQIAEDVQAGEDPIAYVTRLAREKAQVIYDKLSTAEPGLLVLGADTTVTLDNHILGKPEDAADAARMLGLLSGAPTA